MAALAYWRNTFGEENVNGLGWRRRVGGVMWRIWGGG